jgi:hypothetical protein
VSPDEVDFIVSEEQVYLLIRVARNLDFEDRKPRERLTGAAQTTRISVSPRVVGMKAPRGEFDVPFFRRERSTTEWVIQVSDEFA